MSGFFQSDIVRGIVEELEEIQEQIVKGMLTSPYMTIEERKKHIELMKVFLEKQKNLYFRLSLSDDPEAVELKERINQAALYLGKGKNENMSDFFKSLEEQLDSLERFT